MIDFKFRKKRSAYIKAGDDLSAAYRSARADKKTGAEVSDYVVEYWDIFHDAQEEYWVARSRKLLRQAYKLEVPTPLQSFDDGLWEQSQNEDGESGWYLSEEGYAELRKVVRGEQREKSEAAFRWGMLITGVLGTITGLIAVIGTIL